MEHGRLLKKPGNGPKRHTGRDEVEIRYPVKYCFFWIPDSRFAPSGMTSRGCPSTSSGLGKPLPQRLLLAGTMCGPHPQKSRAWDEFESLYALYLLTPDT